MGSRANSELFYGIRYNDTYSVLENEDEYFDYDNFNESVIDKKFPDLKFQRIFIHDDSSFYLAYAKSIHTCDWDSPAVIREFIIDKSREEIDRDIKACCNELGIIYRKPELLMVSYHF